MGLGEGAAGWGGGGSGEERTRDSGGSVRAGGSGSESLDE